MIKKTCHCDALFLTTTESIGPILNGVPTASTTGEVNEINKLEEALEIGISLIKSTHFFIAVGIDHLISQRPHGEIWSLWDVKDLVVCRLCDASALKGPQLTQHSEQRTLSRSFCAISLWSNEGQRSKEAKKQRSKEAKKQRSKEAKKQRSKEAKKQRRRLRERLTVWTCNQEVLTRLNVEREFFDEDVTIWSNKTHSFKSNRFTFEIGGRDRGLWEKLCDR